MYHGGTIDAMGIKRGVYSVLHDLAKICHKSKINSNPFINYFYYKYIYLFQNHDIKLIKTVLNTLLFVYSKGLLGECLTYGMWERGTTQLLLRTLKRGETFVDIGAHVGYYTTLASKLVGDEGKIIAFEPDPNNYKLLCKNIEINHLNNIICERQAITDCVGISKLWLSPFDSGSHSLSRARTRVRHIYVRITSLDHYFNSRQLSLPDYIKIDVEGAELEVLNGMSTVIKNSQNLRLIMEYNPEILCDTGISPEKLFQKLHSYGFDVQLIQKDGSAVKITYFSLLQIKTNVNLYCLKC